MADSTEISITVEKREETGKAHVGRLRHTGMIPAVLYGGGKPPISIVVSELDIKDILKSDAGENSIFLLKLKGGGEERRAMIKEMQKDPMTGKILHLDFLIEKLRRQRAIARRIGRSDFRLGPIELDLDLRCPCKSTADRYADNLHHFLSRCSSSQ